MTSITTAQPVPRWASRVAHAIPFAVLPAGLWRIALGLGVPVGFTGELGALYEAPGWPLTPYVIVLTLVSELFALLSLGLVQGWGEVFPRWIPFLGGRNVPALAAVTAASLGAVAVTAITFFGAVGWNEVEPGAPTGVAAAVMALCYVPMLAWGPLLAIVTVHYYLRRRPHSISDSRPGSNTTGNGWSTETGSPDLALDRTR